jgi:hypothetical protein
MLSLETSLLILKYTGSVVAAAYGVYATVTDFREDRNGKKVLTKKGYYGIALFLVSILVSSDGVKDVREHKQARAEEDRRTTAAAEQKHMSDALTQQLAYSTEINRQLDDARTDLRRTASITASTLSESRRATDPFAPSDGFTLTARMEIPTNQESVGPYLKRISQIPLDLDQEADPIRMVHPVYLFRKHFDSRSKYFPNSSEPSENDLAVRASFGTIVFEFRKSSRRNSNHLLQLT